MGKPIMVAVDDGHGANTAGKRAPDGSMRENQFNDQVCHYCVLALQALRGPDGEPCFDPVRTSPSTADDSFTDRIRRARLAHAKLLVSIHANAGGGTGIECYYWRGDTNGERLARLICEDVMRATGMPYHPGNWPTAWKPDTKAACGTLGLLRMAKDSSPPIVGVLAELGYMDNPTELVRLKSETYRRACGEAVARSLYRYVFGKPPGG